MPLNDILPVNTNYFFDLMKNISDEDLENFNLTLDKFIYDMIKLLWYY